MSDYSDSMLTISMARGGSLSPSSIKKSMARLVLGVDWATFEELGPGRVSFPYRVEEGARVTDQSLGSLELVFLLVSQGGVACPSIGSSLIFSSAYPSPLS